jgi:hypothetical protein
VGGKPIEEKVRNLVAWIGERRETESLKSIDKAILRVVSESSGRNDRKRKVASKNSRPKRPNPSWLDEGSMVRCKLTVATNHFGGVLATAR